MTDTKFDLNILYNSLVQEYNLDQFDITILGLIEYYELMRQKYGKNHCYMSFSRQKDPKKSRVFSYFRKLVCFFEDNKKYIPDPKMYIKSQFEILEREYQNKENRPECLPYMLLGNMALERYIKYVDVLFLEQSSENNVQKIPSKQEYQIIQEINQTHQFIEQFNLNHFGQKSNLVNNIFYYPSLKKAKAWAFIMHKMISPYFLAVSKTFNNIDKQSIPSEFHKELPNNLNIYRKEIYDNNNILNEIIKLFGDEVKIKD